MPDKVLVSPLEGQVVSGIIPIRVEANDPSLAVIEILVDGSSLGTSPTSPFEVLYDTRLHLDGPLEAWRREDSFGPQPRDPRATRIAFILPAAGQVRVTIHDVLGRTRATLVDGWRPAGRSELTWDTRDREGNRVSAGVYWYRIETPYGTAEKKLVVVR